MLVTAALPGTTDSGNRQNVAQNRQNRETRLVEPQLVVMASENKKVFAEHKIFHATPNSHALYIF